MIDGLISIVFLVLFGALLIKATEMVSSALKRLAVATHVGQFGITAFLLALTTSLPETFVGVISAVEGRSGVAVGNVLGANIANLTLVMGGVALVGGGFGVVGNFLRRDLYLAFFAGAIPLFLLMDGRLSRVDGIVLLIVYLIYIVTVLRKQSRNFTREALEEEPFFQRVFQRFHKNHGERAFLKLLFGVAVLLFSAHMIVQLTLQTALSFGVSVLFVGLILVSLGTTLPELAFGMRAVKHHNSSMIFGNLFGSIVANSTFVLGLSSVIKPFELDGGLRSYLVATIVFVVAFFAFWVFASTKKRLERWEGVVLLLIYLTFIFVELRGF